MIGSLVGSWLAGQSVCKLILLGRSGRPGSESKAAMSLVCEGANAEVSMVRCDASSTDDVDAVVLESKQAGGIQAIFHSGGVLADATLAKQCLRGIRTATAPKLNSAMLWQSKLGRNPLSMHVAFSSVAALLGSPGQANYSAANAMMDALSETWKAQGAPGLSLQWGAWAEGGMAAANASTARAVERLGMGMVTPASGLGAIHALLMHHMNSVPAVCAAVPFHWPKFMAQLPEVPPMFSEFIGYWAGPSVAEVPTITRNAAHPALVSSTQAHVQGATSVSPATSAEAFKSQVLEAVKAVLGHEVGADDALMAAGLDSLGSVELKNALERRAGVELPSTLVFDYPTINALAGYLAGKLMTAATLPVSNQAQHVPVSSLSLFDTSPCAFTALSPPGQEVIPTIGMSSLAVRSSQDALLQLMPADCSTMVPLDRWDVAAQEELCGGIPVQFGVFLPGVASFDATAFNLSSTEASLMDPQQRLLLETVAETSFSESEKLINDEVRTDWGVFVGVSSNDYARLAARTTRGVTAYSATGTALSVVSGRVSYTMRLKGPAVTVDTACSSSLVSLHMAFTSLSLGHASLAFNSGVNLTLVPETPAMFQRAGMMTPDGRCKTLDASADGYVRAESVATALLSRVGGASDEQGGSPCCLILRGTAVNQGGRSSTLTAPNGPSQQQVLRNALRHGGVSAAEMTALQMHGTGTPLGDPIEVGAAAAVFVDGQAAVRSQRHLTLFASKSWLGHAEPAAGMVGLSHATAALGHTATLAISHLRELNPYVVSSLKTSGK